MIGLTIGLQITAIVSFGPGTKLVPFAIAEFIMAWALEVESGGDHGPKLTKCHMAT